MFNFFHHHISRKNGLGNDVIVLVLSFFVLWLTPQASEAQTSLWKVTQGDKVLFLGGTVHVLSAADYPLPKEYDAAYAESDTLVFEVDLAEAASLAFQQELLMTLMYSDGRTLESVLSSKAYDRLADYAGSIGFPMAQLKLFKPGMVVMTLTMLELQRLGIAESGVDQHFHGRALKDGKSVAALETIADQLRFLAQMGEGQEDALILKTIDEMKELPTLLGEMKGAWRAGDMDALMAIAVAPMKADYPQLYESLLVERNRLWMPQIEKMMATPEVELILVGAAHLVGREGLLQLLMRRGFTLSRF